MRTQVDGVGHMRSRAGRADREGRGQGVRPTPVPPWAHAHPRTYRFAAVEPTRPGGRPIGVLMGSLRTALSASLPAASLTTLLAACGHQHPAAGAHPSQSAGGAGRIDAGLASVATTTGAVPETHSVLRTKGRLAAFAGRFVAPDDSSRPKPSAHERS